MRNLMIHTFTKYLGHQIEKDEIGKAGRMYGGEERCMHGFGGEIWGKRPSWFFRKWDGGMDWIDLAQDRDG
jgi:hypothetical protein